MALVCAARGYKCHLVAPDDVSVEKQTLIRALGATLQVQIYIHMCMYV